MVWPVEGPFAIVDKVEFEEGNRDIYDGPVREIPGATYTLEAGGLKTLNVFTNPTGCVVSCPAPVNDRPWSSEGAAHQFAFGWVSRYLNATSGPVTFNAPAGITINGAASLTLAPGQWLELNAKFPKYWALVSGAAAGGGAALRSEYVTTSWNMENADGFVNVPVTFQPRAIEFFCTYNEMAGSGFCDWTGFGGCKFQVPGIPPQKPVVTWFDSTRPIGGALDQGNWTDATVTITPAGFTVTTLKRGNPTGLLSIAAWCLG